MQQYFIADCLSRLLSMYRWILSKTNKSIVLYQNKTKTAPSKIKPKINMRPNPRCYSGIQSVVIMIVPILSGYMTTWLHGYHGLDQGLVTK
eukprot:Pgem_evm1s2373